MIPFLVPPQTLIKCHKEERKMLLTITFLPSKDNFVEAQWFNLCWTFSNKKLFTYVKPRDNPYGIPNNLKMALDEGHVHLNSFV